MLLRKLIQAEVGARKCWRCWVDKIGNRGSGYTQNKYDVTFSQPAQGLDGDNMMISLHVRPRVCNRAGGKISRLVVTDPGLVIRPIQR